MIKNNISRGAIALLVLSAALVGCTRIDGSAAPHTQLAADQIFSGGPIVTMDTAQASAEAVAVRDGKIIAVGSAAKINQLKSAQTEMVDLAGNTLVPGFIDGHSHFSMATTSASWANLSGAPVGKVSNIAEVIAELQAQAKRNGHVAGDWIVGFGYDADTLADGRHINRDDLDAVFPDNPVIVVHVSFHGAVLNSRAFEAIGYDATTPTPEGGVIVRREGSNEPLGLVMETAWFPAARALPLPQGEVRFENIKLAQEFYASNGVTTIQDGLTNLDSFELYKEAAERGDLYLDLVALGGSEDLDAFAADKEQYADYHKRLKLAGIKLIVDGSPQGKTAYFTEPYLTGSPSGEADWRGEPVAPAEEVESLIGAVYEKGMRAFVHANADAAVDILLDAHKKHLDKAGDDPRTVIIHSQFIRQDQLEDYARFGMVPAFFSNHAFFWGDVHLNNLGPERANFLSPMKSAADLGIHFTNHNDYIVTPMDQLLTVWSAVNRVSRSGQVIGAQERISTEQALRAITLDGAWQYKEEQRKGSISVGKLADLVVLDANPLTVDPMTIKDIQVLATYKEGLKVYPQ
ncbi:amidohydrolase [Parahaliea sp. F7430]|uniref:Amidohydrolase n=1 Tax=Sediminihaliea albiluteola TaxID=2758564 RepID=A0A7W2YJJ6_9GAMM|nr:amidohydrolase [Sediminihaliea albiluteola]MBA6413152.1 amidohydrolase [Sediminihaliea albiluteola]